MNALEIMLRSIGFDPAVLQETQQVFVGIAEAAQRMEAQLHRIELNTLQILEGQGDTVPAGPTNYDIMPVMPALPRMEHEAVPPVESEAA